MKRHLLSVFAQLVVVFLSVVTPMASPLTAPIEQTFLQRQTHPGRHGPAPYGPVRSLTIYPQSVSFNSLHKRMMPGFTPTITLKRVYFHTLTAMVPVTAPARFLEDFFSSIAIKADPITGEWGSQLPQRDQFDIIEGGFRLRFSAIGDTIPWSFVKHVAERMWECAVLGVAGLFDTVYTNEAAKIGVQISLTLLDESSVASGSGSGSGTGYREGSWDSITSPGGGS